MEEESFVILSSQRETVQDKKDEISKIFNVKVDIQADPNRETDGNVWVHVTGNERKAAKGYIIAICNPEISEKISFPGFPTCIFKAFEGQCRHYLERTCEIVLTVSDDEWIILQGTNMGVTIATSKIHHLTKLHKDKDSEKYITEARNFDLRLEELGESKDKLKNFSNSLKKELLEMIGMPKQSQFASAMDSRPVQETQPESHNIASTSAAMPLVSSQSNTERKDSVILINDSIDDDSDIGDGDKNASVVVISSSSSEYESENEAVLEIIPKRMEVAADGINQPLADLKYILPPNFAIVEWLKVHYQATNDPSHFVAKREMLEHFQRHFDIPEHPDLANYFFDKLAVTIFKTDPNFRCVRTKKSKNKHSRRRLICLRRRTISEGEQTVGPSQSTSKAVTQFPNPPKVQGIMYDWNANRNELTEQGIKPKAPEINSNKGPAGSPVRKQSGNVGMQASPELQKWLGEKMGPGEEKTPVHMPPQGAPKNIFPRGPHPVVVAPPKPNFTNPEPRVPPLHDSRALGTNPINSIAVRVSKMSDQELLSRNWPQPNPRLRPIIIDGSNVAVSHGNGKKFSCRGIAICVRFFIERGHGDVTCFVPNYRKGGGGNPPSYDSQILIQLENMGFVKCTPSRRIRRENVVCYDDRFIVELAAANNGVILSNDQYRDLMWSNPEWQKIIEERLLQYTIVKDLLMLPQDPHGRRGPTLDEFLLLQNFHRAPASNPSLLGQPPRQRMMSPSPRFPPPRPIPTTSTGFQQPFPTSPAWRQKRNARQYLPISPQEEENLVQQMLIVFPDRDQDIRQFIRSHPREKNIDKLMNFFLIRETGK